MRLKPITITLWRGFALKVLVLGILCATSVFSDVSLWCVFARNSSTTETQRLHREEKLVKQINQRAERFYKTFIRKNPGTDPLDSEITGHFEDLLLTIDGLANPLYRRHNLVIAMRIASAIERLLLLADVSSDAVMAWARLHADLDLLAKVNGLRWSEAVVTNELIADLGNDVDRFSKGFQSEFSQLHNVSLKTSDLLVLLEDFRHSAQALNAALQPAVNIRFRVEAVRNHSRLITEALNRRSITSALRSDWRRVTSQLEELVRLYLLDSVGSIQKLPHQNTLSALFTALHEARNLHYRGGVL